MDNSQEHRILNPPFEWIQPKAHSLWSSNTLLKGWKGKFFRTLLIVVLIELFVYFLFKPLPLKEIDFNLQKIVLITLLFAIGMSSYAYLIGPYTIRFSKTKYKINEKGIRINNHLNHWKNIIKCCPIKKHDLLENIICLYFYTKHSPDRPYALLFDKTQNNLAEQVYNYIQMKISAQIHTPLKTKQRLNLSTNQHICMCSLSLIGALLFIYLIPRIENLDNDFKPLLSLLVLFFGPGTWGIFLLYGKNLFKYRDWFGWMIIYNFLTLIVLVMILMIKSILMLSELIKTSQ